MMSKLPATTSAAKVSDEERDNFFQLQRSKLENRTCFDCAARNTSWLTTTYALYLCLNCSANHRRYGTHISFVRSCTLDNFTRDQLRRMEVGGNGRARLFFRTHGYTDGRTVDYHSKIAQKYRASLDKELSETSNASIGANDGEVKLSAQNTKTGTGAVPDTTVTEDNEPCDLVGDDAQQVAANGAGSVRPPSKSSNQQSSTSTARPAAVTGPQTASSHHASSGTGSASWVKSADVKAKKIDFDFDFDGVITEGPATPPPSSAVISVTGNDHFSSSPTVVTKVQKSSVESYSKSKETGASLDVDPPIKENRFSSSAAISSAEYFSQPQNESAADRMKHQANLTRLHQATAISSADFGGGEAVCNTNANGENSFGFEEETIEQLATMTESAKDGWGRLSRNAQDAYSRATSWFSTL